MIELLARYFLIISTTALTTYLLVRAGNYFPARLLALVNILFVSLALSTGLRQEVRTTELAYWLAAANVVMLGLLTVAMLLLLSQLFTPEWWHGRQAIRWIALPYMLVIMLLTIDLIAGTGIIFAGISEVDGRLQLRSVQPMSLVVLIVFTASWLVHIGLLIGAFVRQPRQRKSILALLIGLGASVACGTFFTKIPVLVPIQTVSMALPVLGTLTYAVLRTQMLAPTQAAFDLAVAAIRDAVLVTGPDGTLLYANPAAQRLGMFSKQPLAAALAAAGVVDDLAARLLADNVVGAPQSLELTVAGRQLIVEHTPVQDRRGQVVSQLLIGRDVTELEQRSAQLEDERRRLAATVYELEAREQERDSLAATLRAQALPVIPILDGVLVMPLVGDLDATRATDLTEVLLQAIEREQARLILLDITGVPLLDTASAAALIQATQAAALLGARCTLVGIRPEIAQTLVSLGVTFDNLTTAATLQQGLQGVLAARR
jgi:rsbT co-antagonist protein RsbR